MYAWLVGLVTSAIESWVAGLSTDQRWDKMFAALHDLYRMILEIEISIGTNYEPAYSVHDALTDEETGLGALAQRISTVEGKIDAITSGGSSSVGLPEDYWALFEANQYGSIAKPGYIRGLYFTTGEAMVGKVITDALQAWLPCGEEGATFLEVLMAALANPDTGILQKLILLLKEIKGYPGSALVTFGEPVEWSGPVTVDVPMAGCILEIVKQADGTGKYVVDAVTNWQRAGWLSFYADDGSCDEVQWLSLEKAAYTAKRLAAPAGVLLWPRPGSSGTLTPYTLPSAE